MPEFSPTLLALDFDGVLCDGLHEYFQSSKRTYQLIWPETPDSKLDACAEDFYRLRPVIESGWEMPLLLRALVLNIELEKITNQWTVISEQLTTDEKVDKTQLGTQLDQVRDQFIATELDDWLRLHQFFPGVLDQLSAWLKSPTLLLYVVTTKEGRFVRQLLQNHNLTFPPEQIIGKEIRQPKVKTLQQLCHRHQCDPIQLWFVEDLAKTLNSVAQAPEFANTPLFLADWGYNTATVRSRVKTEGRLHVLNLTQFTGEFGTWLL